MRRAASLVRLILALACAVAAAREGTPVRIAPPGADAAAAERVFHLKDAPEVDLSSCGPVHRRLLVRYGLLPGVLEASADGRAAVSEGVQAFVGGKIATADDRFAEAERAVGCSPALAYDRALCGYGLGRRAAAVSALLRAIAADPGNREYRETFAFVSEQYGLNSQVLPLTVLSPDLLFAGTVALGLAALAALGLLLVRRDGSWFIAFTLLALGACACGALLAYDAIEARASLAVVAPASGALRRVPLDQAQVWMTLAQGTTVRIRGRAGDYVLVETGLRVEGWLHSSLLLETAAAR